MKNRTYKKSAVLKRLTAFLGLPLIFVFVAYFTVYLIANPIVAPAASLLSMLVGDSVPSFDSDNNSNENVDFIEIGTKQEETIPIDSINFPKVGDKYAHITIPGTGVDCDVYYGDSNPVLKKGPGQYEWSKLPGFGSTTLVAAHVTTHFKGLQYVNIGDTIYYTTSYGAYEYKVTDILVVKAAEAKAAYDLRAEYDNLVLYTCYPFYSIAFRSQRFFVCAELVSGPRVNIYQTDSAEGAQ